MQSHAGTDFDKQQFLDIVNLFEHSLELVDHLVAAEVNRPRKVVERNDVVNKWFRFGVVLWSVESLDQHFFDKSQVRLTVERSVEREEGPRVLEAVAL